MFHVCEDEINACAGYVVISSCSLYELGKIEISLKSFEKLKGRCMS